MHCREPYAGRLVPIPHSSSIGWARRSATAESATRYSWQQGTIAKSLPKIVPLMYPRISQIDGKLRRGLVKIRTAIQMASANSNSAA
jgi:hypothetical protein